jgi:hypothetical protein
MVSIVTGEGFCEWCHRQASEKSVREALIGEESVPLTRQGQWGVRTSRRSKSSVLREVFELERAGGDSQSLSHEAKKGRLEFVSCVSFLERFVE